MYDNQHRLCMEMHAHFLCTAPALLCALLKVSSTIHQLWFCLAQGNWFYCTYSIQHGLITSLFCVYFYGILFIYKAHFLTSISQSNTKPYLTFTVTVTSFFHCWIRNTGTQFTSNIFSAKMILIYRTKLLKQFLVVLYIHKVIVCCRKVDCVFKM